MKNKIYGIGLILLALYYILAMFVPSIPHIGLFRLLISFWLLGMAIPNIIKLKFFSGLVPVAIVAVLFKSEIAMACNVSPHTISSFTIIVSTCICCIGLDMVFSDVKRKRRKARKFNKKLYKEYTYTSNKEDNVIDGEAKFVDEEDISNGTEINFEVNFSSAVKYVDANDLVAANFSSNFGNLNVYLDKAGIKDNRVVINSEVAFGGITLFIPKQWHVINNMDSSFGSITERGSCAKEGIEVILNGEASFGKIEIVYI